MSIFVPLKLVGENNQREHWATRLRRKKSQQAAVHYALLAQRPTVLFPVRVTLRRVGGRRMDPGNHEACFKHVQDAVARYLGVDDGDEQSVRWAYEQEPGGKRRGLEIQLEVVA